MLRGLPRESDRRGERGRSILLGAVLVVATVVAYLPALRAGFIWDDDFYVTDNATLHDLDGLRRIWLETDANPQYYPVTFTSFWIDYHLYALDPRGYHLTNVLLHAATAVLVWRILRHLGVKGAWLAGALFALHPVQVESVAWVTERKNTLSALFYAGAALSYLRFALPRDERPARGAPWASFVLFALALLSKSVTATLPLALGVVLVWKRARIPRAHLLWLGSMVVLGAAMGSVTALLESRQVGAQGEAFSLSFLERALVAGRIVWFYLGKIVWPFPLAFVYPRWPVETSDPVAYLYPLAALALPVLLYRSRGRIGAGPLVAFFYFGLTLGPVLGFVNVYPMQYSFVADHFQYLAAIGPLALLAAMLTWAPAKLFHPLGPVARRTSTAVLLVALGALTWRQTLVYRSEESVWRDTISKNHSAWLAHYNLGKILEARGAVEEAEGHYRAAVAAKPDLLDAIMNLANLTASRGGLDEAISLYRGVLERKPNHPFAHFNLGLALETKGQREAAIAEYREVLRIVPDPNRVESALGGLLFRRGDFGLLVGRTRSHLEALMRSGAAPSTTTSRADALVREGNALADQGRLDEAVSRYEQALSLDPRNALAHYNLGLALETRDDQEGAIAHYTAALASAPELAGAHNNLAVLLYRKGDYLGAWREAHLSRRYGVAPHPEFLKALSAKVPEPRE